MLRISTNCRVVAEADEKGTGISCGRYSSTNYSPFFIQANQSNLISLMIYGRVSKEEVSCDLLMGVFCPNVQPAEERREDV
jgi:hypothetical protein